MHRCLQIVEVLRAVVEKLGENEKPTLLSIAMTCRSFFDPAMDVLWEKLDRPEVLFSCLPARTRGKGLDLYTITTPPTTTEWQRFEQYARRIKSFRAYSTFGTNSGEDEDEDESHVAECSWESLKAYYPEKILFPNLRAFECGIDELDEWYSFIFSPALTSIAIHYNNSESALHFCDAVSVCEKTLAKLELSELWAGSTSKSVYEKISQTVATMPFLQVLNMPRLLPETLAHLAALPKLNELSTTIDSVPYHLTQTKHHTFTVLKTLCLTSKNVDEAALLSLFRSCRFPNLTTLVIQLNAHHDLWGHFPGVAPQVTTLFDAVSQIKSLRNFKLSSTSDHIVSRKPLGLQVLSGLFNLHDLEVLEISQSPCGLSSDDIPTIARTWPKLRSLVLGVFRNFIDLETDRAVLTLEDLQPFAEHCLHIESLGLPLKFFDSPASPPLTFGHATSRLRTIECGHYPVRYFPSVPTFIASVFPHARLSRHPFHTTSSLKDDLAIKAINDTVDNILRAFEEGRKFGA